MAPRKQTSRLATAVFITEPTTHATIVLAPGTEVTDPEIRQQITHPSAWQAEPSRGTKEPR